MEKLLSKSEQSSSEQSSPEQPVALVTGASSGIGAAYARALAQAGYWVILVGRNHQKLQAVHKETGGEIVLADFATDLGLRALEYRVQTEDRLDFLVNNAGFGTAGKFWLTGLAGQDAMHRVHVLATMRLTAAALPRMVRRNRGSIVNVSSVAAWMPTVGSINYSATKAWMNSFTEGLWLELKSVGSGVRVQALCPGFTRSDFHRTMGMDTTRIPESLWTSADSVVAESLRGLVRNQPIVVPGWRYRAWVGMQRFLPRIVLHLIAVKSGETFRNPAIADR